MSAALHGALLACLLSYQNRLMKVSAHPAGPTEYSIKREANYNNWRDARRSLAEAAMARQAPLHPPQLCSVGGCGNEGIVKCSTCSMAGAGVCAEYDQKLHTTAHCHNRQHWLDGFCQNLAPHRFLVPLEGPRVLAADGPSSPADQLPPGPLGYAVQGADHVPPVMLVDSMYIGVCADIVWLHCRHVPPCG